jgi:GT2 family glycosyltransferase
MIESRLPFVSVVVPVLNGAETIGSCLTAVLGGDYPQDRREVLVVDNGSTDGTSAVVRDLSVRYLWHGERGPARARNVAIPVSQGEIVAFTDADCVPTTAWLRELVTPFVDESVGGVAGEIVPYPPRTAAERHAARIRHLSPQRYLRRPVFPFAVTANLAFRRRIFDQIGLFDPRTPRGGESTDFCRRFRETGLDLVLAPRALVLHRYRSTSWEYVSQWWGYGRGHAFLYAKYRGEIPWGWRQTRGAYADLIRNARLLGGEALRFASGRGGRDELENAYFELLRKLAMRAGFARESLALGRFAL